MKKINELNIMKKAFTFLLMLSLFFTLGGCGSSTTGTISAPTVSSLSSPSATPVTPIIIEEPEPEEEQKKLTSSFSVGDTAEIGNWSISVSDFEYADRIEPSQYSHYSPDEGNQYAVVHVSISNRGKEASTFLPAFAFQNEDITTTIVYQDEYEFSASRLMAYDDDIHDKHLNPLTSASGVIVFQLPESVVNASEKLSLVFALSDKQIEFILR